MGPGSKERGFVNKGTAGMRRSLGPQWRGDKRAVARPERWGSDRSRYVGGRGAPGGCVWEGEIESVKQTRPCTANGHGRGVGASVESPVVAAGAEGTVTPPREWLREGTDVVDGDSPGGPQSVVATLAQLVGKDTAGSTWFFEKGEQGLVLGK